MIFLTYNDAFSGIYRSQVTDVCSFFEKELGVKTKLVALVSVRNFWSQRKLIRTSLPGACVLPMFPKAKFWKFNIPLLFLSLLFSTHKSIWARGVFACNMALSLKKAGLFKKVVFDARGAYLAELTEYDVVKDESVKKKIAEIERRALFQSDAQLAVSHKLVAWWKEQYDFTPSNFQVIPCTLSNSSLTSLPSATEIEKIRENMGFASEDIVLAYAGSAAGWQSFELVDAFLNGILQSNPKVKILFLSPHKPEKSRIFQEFPHRIYTAWVKPSMVGYMLIGADYGLLIREATVTNKVASPVKFAEYISCGLQVLISEGVGDFTEFVREYGCGNVYPQLSLARVTYIQKKKNNELALKFFSKNSPRIKSAYTTLLNQIHAIKEQQGNLETIHQNQKHLT